MPSKYVLYTCDVTKTDERVVHFTSRRLEMTNLGEFLSFTLS